MVDFRIFLTLSEDEFLRRMRSPGCLGVQIWEHEVEALGSRGVRNWDEVDRFGNRVLLIFAAGLLG